MLNVVKLRIIMLNVVMLRIIMLKVVILAFVMLNVVMQSVVAPLAMSSVPYYKTFTVSLTFAGHARSLPNPLMGCTSEHRWLQVLDCCGSECQLQTL
jgi:hypothetical protein